MPIATQCLEPGCRTLTIGPLCIEHDRPAVPAGVSRERPGEDGAALEGSSGRPDATRSVAGPPALDVPALTA